MTAFVTTAAQSATGPGILFDQDVFVASTYLLEAGAFLHSTTVSESVRLGGAAAWNVTINGQISTGSLLDAALALYTSVASKVTIAEDASVRNGGNYFGAFYSFGDVTLTNKGIVMSETGNGVGIFGDNTSSITNSGIIAGKNAALYVEDAAVFTLTNSGQTFGNLAFSNGTNKLVNTGQITTSSLYGVSAASVGFGSGADTVDNKGLISGIVDLGAGNNTLKNSGSILGDDGSGYGIKAGTGTDKVDILKGGFVSNGVSLGDGTNTFTNAGSVGFNSLHKSFSGGTGVDTVKNTGNFEGGVDLFGGNDVFTNTGSIGGEIELGTGDDKFTGGNAAEVVLDNAGKDDYKLGGGDDWFAAFGGEGSDDLTDTVDGGTGVDTYDGSSRQAVYINLDSANHTSNGWSGFGSPVLNKSSALETEGLKVDNLKNFENFMGTGNADIFFGSSAANTVFGGGSGDEIHGLAGNDTLKGEDGDDYLSGGAGADVLTGGNGFDQFDFSAASESGVTKATRDTITDFVSGVDAIHFSGALAGKFTSYLGENTVFTNNAGQLRSYFTATGIMLEGDIDGNGKADFSIFFEDINHALSFSLVGDDLFGGP